NATAACSEGHVAACSFSSTVASMISIGLLPSESRRQVTCSPSLQRMFTETALAQTMRPSMPSSLRRTRLPILIACGFVLAAAGVFFLLLIAVSQKRGFNVRVALHSAALSSQDSYLRLARHIKSIPAQFQGFFPHFLPKAGVDLPPSSAFSKIAVHARFTNREVAAAASPACPDDQTVNALAKEVDTTRGDSGNHRDAKTKGIPSLKSRSFPSLEPLTLWRAGSVSDR